MHRHITAVTVTAAIGAVVAFAFALVLAPQQVVAQAFSGFSDVPRAEVRLDGILTAIDGDTLRVDDRDIGLFGIDAPELSERCQGGTDFRGECGLEALRVVLELIANIDTLECVIRDISRSREILATCRSQDFDVSESDLDTTDLAEIMVGKGLARPESDDIARYRIAELNARREGRGFWACDATTPPGWNDVKRNLCN